MSVKDHTYRKPLTIMIELAVLLLAFIVVWMNWPLMPILDDVSVEEIEPGRILVSSNLTSNHEDWKVSLILNGEETIIPLVSSEELRVWGRRITDAMYQGILNVTPGNYEYYFKAVLGRMERESDRLQLSIEDWSPAFEPSVRHLRLPDTSNLRGPYRTSIGVSGSTLGNASLIYFEDGMVPTKLPMNRRGDIYEASLPGPGEPVLVFYYFRINSTKGEIFRYPPGEDSYFTFRTYDSEGIPQQYVMSTIKMEGGFGPLDENIAGTFWSYHSLRSLWLLDALDDLGQTTEWLQDREAKEDDMLERSKIIASLGWLNCTTSNVTATKSFFYDRLEEITRSGFSRPNYRDIKRLLLITEAYEAINWTLPQIPSNWWSSLLSQQNEDGGWAFVDGPSSLAPTYYAVGLLSKYHIPILRPQRLEEFIGNHRNSDGAYAGCPGLDSDVRYTYYAVQMLQELGYDPQDTESLLCWLTSLQNADGGFGDRPGWTSRTESTNYALSCFSILDTKAPQTSSAPIRPGEDFEAMGLQIYRAEFEAPGIGLPGEIIDYRHKLGIHLVALKSSATFAAEARNVGEELGSGQLILISPEEYGVRYEIPGYGFMYHISEFVGVVGHSYGHRYFGAGNWPTYEEFKVKGIASVHDGGGLFFSDFLKPFDVYDMIVSDSIDSCESYDLFAPVVGVQDALLSNPEFRKYIGQVPLIVNTDSHYDSWRMIGRTNVASTLYLARNGSWEGFLEAVQLNRLASIMRDQRGVTIYARPDLTKFLYGTIDLWSWWGKPSTLSYPFLTYGQYSERLFNDSDIHLVVRSSRQIASVTLDNTTLHLEQHKPDGLSSATIAKLTISPGPHEVRIFVVDKELLRVEKFHLIFKGDPFTHLELI